MKTEIIIAEGDGKKEAEAYMLFTDMIKTATNGCDITRVHVVDNRGEVLYTRWKIAERK
jgi:hypothetical protein